MRKKIFVVLAVFITICNMAFGLYNDNEITELASLKIEAFANIETDGGIRGPLYKYGCVVVIDEIVGYESDNSPIIHPTPYGGELGKCGGVEGTCTPFSCTKLR